MELFSEKISAGKRTYFLDVKKSREGILYLTISESQRNQDDKYEHTRVMVFQENIPAFVEAFNKAMTAMGFRQGVNTYVNEVRKTFPNAYRPWSKDDDEKLERLFCQKKTISQLAEIFQRKEGAIESRVKRLELREEYSSNQP